MNTTITTSTKTRQPTYFNEADGHTYWLEEAELWAAPTNTDGSIDRDGTIFVDDFDDPITPEERNRIRAILESEAA